MILFVEANAGPGVTVCPAWAMKVLHFLKALKESHPWILSRGTPEARMRVAGMRVQGCPQWVVPPPRCFGVILERILDANPRETRRGKTGGDESLGLRMRQQQWQQQQQQQQQHIQQQQQQHMQRQSVLKPLSRRCTRLSAHDHVCACSTQPGTQCRWQYSSE
jgi:hypothetical protein